MSVTLEYATNILKYYYDLFMEYHEKAMKIDRESILLRGIYGAGEIQRGEIDAAIVEHVDTRGLHVYTSSGKGTIYATYGSPFYFIYNYRLVPVIEEPRPENIRDKLKPIRELCSRLHEQGTDIVMFPSNVNTLSEVDLSVYESVPYRLYFEFNEHGNLVYRVQLYDDVVHVSRGGKESVEEGVSLTIDVIMKDVRYVTVDLVLGKYAFISIPLVHVWKLYKAVRLALLYIDHVIRVSEKILEWSREHNKEMYRSLTAPSVVSA